MVRRSTRARLDDRPLIGSLNELRAYLTQEMAYCPVEQVRVLYLGASNRLIRDCIVCEGGVDHASIMTRAVIGQALDLGAYSVILVHNHPSGEPSPSAADLRATAKLGHALRYIDVKLFDHLIVARTGIVSLRSLGHI